MALSGSKNYSITRADIIESALRKIGVYDQSDAVEGDATRTASLALNLMVKELTARGADLWLRNEITLFLQPNQQSYAIGTDHVTDTYVESTLSSAGVAGQTVLSITSTTGMTTGDFFGVKLDDDTIQWSTVTVDSATQGTIATALTGDASSGNKVYAYTTKADRPTRLLYAFRRDVNNYDSEVSLIGENDYRGRSDKGSEGPPIEAWYNPTLTTGTLYVWPVDGGATYDKLIMIAQYYSDDLDIAGNNPQFPIEWGNTLVWQLAAELAPEYGIPQRQQDRLLSRAEFKLNELLDYDQENANVELELDVR